MSRTKEPEHMHKYVWISNVLCMNKCISHAPSLRHVTWGNCFIHTHEWAKAHAWIRLNTSEYVWIRLDESGSVVSHTNEPRHMRQYVWIRLEWVTSHTNEPWHMHKYVRISHMSCKKYILNESYFTCKWVYFFLLNQGTCINTEWVISHVKINKHNFKKQKYTGPTESHSKWVRSHVWIGLFHLLRDHKGGHSSKQPIFVPIFRKFANVYSTKICIHISLLKCFFSMETELQGVLCVLQCTYTHTGLLGVLFPCTATHPQHTATHLQHVLQ